MSAVVIPLRATRDLLGVVRPGGRTPSWFSMVTDGAGGLLDVPQPAEDADSPDEPGDDEVGE
jgi:hypothetical protein